MTSSKFARGQRMSFLQLQQQTREKCQEIWDRQVQSLSAVSGDENDGDPEANSDLDSFAGDLENLLDAEECEDEAGNGDLKFEKADVARGLKMRRCHTFAQTEEEMEDDEAEAATIHRMLEGDEFEMEKKKKPIGTEVLYPQLCSDTAGAVKKMGTGFRHVLNNRHPDGLYTTKEVMIQESEGNNLTGETNTCGKAKVKKVNGKNEDIAGGFVKKIYKAAKDGTKKHADRRESFVCGACGQLGHMRTNKNCPKYGEDAEPSEMENVSGKSHLLDASNRLQMKVMSKKSISTLRDVAEEVPESSEKQGPESLVKVPQLKFKFRSVEKSKEKSSLGSQSVNKQVTSSTFVEAKPIGKNLIIPIKMKSDVQPDTPKPTVRILPPQGIDREAPKKIVIKQPKVATSTQVKEVDVARDHFESRKIKKITELSSSFEQQRKMDSQYLVGEEMGRNHFNESRRWEEKRRSTRRVEEESTRMMIEERRAIETRRYEESIRRDELQHAKKKKLKKKKKKPDFSDDYLMDHRPYRTDRRLPERDRVAKRRNLLDAGLTEYAPQTKRRRGGEVVLSNILESIVDQLRDNIEISYLFLKPVTKKEAPDYLDIIKNPMDLSTIRDKVRNMEYRSKEDFRHDVWQIAYNAHKYNDRRNPGIPPLADQLLELCDYLLIQKDEILTEAEAGIESANI
ncbi:hypothetical protein HPP92_017202 [Vanilla planifolia]|uniref:Bromo domain-containing protein n=1 Tax=Vanilla planifolia TaxID=51239 RepID=A0A835QMM5_VANPL|nr:hypothetical protein HPP92_017202 [Vanilla planifolia]